jgi:glycosyltransferase involved in cell wall biosynthesis
MAGQEEGSTIAGMKRIHVLHIRDSSGVFGGERAILTLARNLDRNVFDLTLLCMRRPDGRSEPLISLAQGMGIRVESLEVRGRMDVRAVARLREFVFARGVSLIHTHDFKSNFYGLLATLNTNVRRVATAHGSTRDSLRKRAYLFLDERLVYQSFHRIITVSEDLRAKLSVSPAVRDKLTVVPNGLDPGLLSLSSGHDDTPLSYSPVPGAKTFAVVGRLFPDKGQTVFIQAFSRIAMEFPHAAGLIAGDGPSAGDVRKLIEELGLLRRIHCCGARSNIREVYDQTDFLVIPSYTEGLPYALLEAMGLGIPILATAVGDIPTVVKDGVTGFLVPPGDVGAMADRMGDLLLMPTAAGAMARAGKEFVDETCSAGLMVRRTEAVYKSLVPECRTQAFRV